MQVKFVNYDRSYLSHKKEYNKAMQGALKKGDLILRETTEIFEQNLARFVGTKYAVALSSGTDAIYLSLKALGVKGNLVALPSHTFKSTCGAIINAGMEPVVYDMDGTFKETGYPKNFQISGYAAHIHIPVHMSGELSSNPYLGLPNIEDACQAFGAVKNPTTAAQCWSFYPAKILGGYGDGGAITTNDKKIYEYAREARNHFKDTNEDFGGNHRMDNVMAAYLLVKLKYIYLILARRKEIAEMYLDNLKGVGLPNNSRGRVWQDFIIRCKFPQILSGYLKNRGIETMRNEYPWSPEYPKLPLAAKYESETLRLPCNENLTDKEVNYVIKEVNEFFKK